MATFSSTTFSVSSYAAFRPTYSSDFLSLILAYHGQEGASNDVPCKVAMDLGCGTGQATKSLLRSFAKVIGVDPSESMIMQAEKESRSWNEPGEIDFIVSRAEDVASKLTPCSIDLITAGQAAHWFDQDLIWDALSKTLKPGGYVAFWGYSSFTVKEHPHVAPLISSFASDVDSLGPFWQQPGTARLENQYRDLSFPTSPDWNPRTTARIYFEGADDRNMGLPYYSLDDILKGTMEWPNEAEWRTDPVVTKYFTWDGMAEYFKTWSAVHSYQAQHPEDKIRSGNGPNGDIVDRFVTQLKDTVGGDLEGVDVYWPLVAMLIKKTDQTL